MFRFGRVCFLKYYALLFRLFRLFDLKVVVFFASSSSLKRVHLRVSSSGPVKTALINV